jgi:hypothetical protein
VLKGAGDGGNEDDKKKKKVASLSEPTPGFWGKMDRALYMSLTRMAHPKS